MTRAQTTFIAEYRFQISEAALKIDQEKLCLAAADIYNDVSSAHNARTDVLIDEGLTPSEIAIAAYMAMRAAVSRFEPHVNGIVTEATRPSLERLIEIMCKHIEPVKTAGVRA